MSANEASAGAVSGRAAAQRRSPPGNAAASRGRPAAEGRFPAAWASLAACFHWVGVGAVSREGPAVSGFPGLLRCGPGPQVPGRPGLAREGVALRGPKVRQNIVGVGEGVVVSLFSLESVSPVSLGCPAESGFSTLEEQLQMKDLGLLPCF